MTHPDGPGEDVCQAGFQDDQLDLYYHTTSVKARKVVRERKIPGLDGFVYLSTDVASTRPFNEGTTPVHVRVPADLAELRVEYLDGENVYRVPADQVDVIELA